MHPSNGCYVRVRRLLLLRCFARMQNDKKEFSLKIERTNDRRLDRIERRTLCGGFCKVAATSAEFAAASATLQRPPQRLRSPKNGSKIISFWQNHFILGKMK